MMFNVGDLVVYSGGQPVDGWAYRDGKPRRVEGVTKSGGIILKGFKCGPLIPDVFTLYNVDLENK